MESVMSHLSSPCSVGISELIKVCVLEMNVVWEETWGKETQAQEGLGQTARGCEAGIILSQFWSLYFIQMMKTPSRDRHLIWDDDSESIKSTAKAKGIKKPGWTLSYWLDLLAAQIKSWVTAMGWSVVISRPRCQEALVLAASHYRRHTHTDFCSAERQEGNPWSSFPVYAKPSWQNRFISF